MSGRVIHQPDGGTTAHTCSDLPWFPPFGTLWRCDDCGLIWRFSGTVQWEVAWPQWWYRRRYEGDA